MTDEITQAWIRNKSDEMAVANGCRFDAERGAFTVWWIESFCKLYEGEGAGGPLTLRGCHECDYGLPASHETQWDEEGVAIALERARLHNECHAAGHRLDWQYECTMRMFSWERWSDKWQRWIRRFRQSCIYISKKNKKSPSLAAWAIYLLCGDGEPGQKVFLAAKDGNQARDIAGKHASEMLNQSDMLQAECTFNKVLCQITHEPTRSIMKPLSSANSRTQQSKEGLNGSLFVDETHVVDREYMNRVNRAGISRMEPVQAEFSTAGNNPDGYGKERFDHAVKVESGAVEDQALFAAVYAAPQDLSNDALDQDPLKYGLMANPAMGHTVDPEEYLEDYARSKSSISALNEFKMYRLNIWQHAKSPWLKTDAWVKCREDYTEEDLYGETCWMGLDLSQTKDMSSIVLAFKDDDEYRLLPYFWIPENEARRNSHHSPFLQWESKGHLFFCNEDWIDQRQIREFVDELADKFNIVQIRYDKTYANELTLDIEEKLGIERVEFPQSMMSFAGPTAAFEGAVIAGKLHHNAHPVLDWQIGHVQVKSDYNNNKRPVKPKSQDMKKIDGVVAAIMGFSGAVAGDHKKPSPYSERGIFTI